MAAPAHKRRCLSAAGDASPDFARLPPCPFVYKRAAKLTRVERAVLWRMSVMAFGLDGAPPRRTATTYFAASVPLAEDAAEVALPLVLLKHTGASLYELLGTHVLGREQLRDDMRVAVGALADAGYVHADLGSRDRGAAATLKNITYDATSGTYALIDFGKMRRAPDDWHERDAEARRAFIDDFVDDLLARIDAALGAQALSPERPWTHRRLVSRA